MAAKWSNTIFVVRKTGDYWGAFADQYPDVNRWVDAVVSEAGTSDADAKVLQAAGAMLADFSEWARAAQDAMRERRAIRFDALCSELDDMTRRFVR